MRVELASPELADFGVDGPLLDQRIKLVFPNAAGGLASLAGADASWWSTWLDIPEEERGHMRTYSVRDVRRLRRRHPGRRRPRAAPRGRRHRAGLPLGGRGDAR